MSLNTIKLENLRAHQALERKQELINSGLVMNVDFIWRYVPSRLFNDPYAEFTFTNPSLCAFYHLLWK